MPSVALRLRPGVHVVRRDAALLQVGLDPPHRVLLPADPAVLDLVARLESGTLVGAPAVDHARHIQALRDADLLSEPVVEASPRPTVTVLDRGFAEATDQLSSLLEGADLDVVERGHADLVIACSAAPLRRALVDAWLGEGTPHLIVAGTGSPGSLRVGPLVEPGVTACLRCIDAAESVGDPRRPLLVEQLSVLPAGRIDPLVLWLGSAWAARDAVAYVSGAEASTWSATIDTHEPSPRVVRWARHPECGCCWDLLPY